MKWFKLFLRVIGTIACINVIAANVGALGSNLRAESLSDVAHVIIIVTVALLLIPIWRAGRN